MKYWRHSRELCEVRIAAKAAQTDHAQANSSDLLRPIFAGRVKTAGRTGVWIGKTQWFAMGTVRGRLYAGQRRSLCVSQEKIVDLVPDEDANAACSFRPS